MKRIRLTITLQEHILKKLDRYIDGNKIRNRSHAIEVILTKEFKNQIIKLAVILDKGDFVTINGRRTSKLLLPINNKTLIEHNIDYLKDHGITDMIISMRKPDKQVRELLGDGSKYGIKVVYFVRDLGRGGVLRLAKSLLVETFLMMNGDILLDGVDLRDMYAYHKNCRGKGTILLTAVHDNSGLGTVEIKGNRIVEFVEKPKAGKDTSQIINAGVYLFEPSVCDLVTSEDYLLEHYIFPTLAASDALYGYMLNGPWHHLHDLKRYNNYLTEHHQ